MVVAIGGVLGSSYMRYGRYLDTMKEVITNALSVCTGSLPLPAKIARIQK
jgi:hypothetical protein